MSEDARDASHVGPVKDRSWWGNLNPRYILLLGGGLAIIALGITLRIAGDLAWGIYALLAFVVSGIGLLVIACFPLSAKEPRGSYSEAHPPNSADLTGPMPSTGRNPSPSSPRSLRQERSGYSSVPTVGPSPLARSSPGKPFRESLTPTMGRLSDHPVDPFSMDIFDSPWGKEPKLYIEGALLVPDPAVGPNAQEREPRSPLPKVAVLAAPFSADSKSVEPEVKAAPELYRPPVVSGPISRDSVAPAPQMGASRTPIPPLVRSISEPATAPVTRPASGLRGPPQSNRCANCRKPVRYPKTWRRCPDCQHQLCTHCLVEALLAYEGSWCNHCAGLRHLDSLAKELRPPPLGPSSSRIGLEQGRPPFSWGGR